jgi:hypothetical protein
LKGRHRHAQQASPAQQQAAVAQVAKHIFLIIITNELNYFYITNLKQIYLAGKKSQ